MPKTITPIEVACPRCMALAGEKCNHGSGKMDRFHQTRYDYAKKMSAMNAKLQEWNQIYGAVGGHLEPPNDVRNEVIDGNDVSSRRVNHGLRNKNWDRRP